MCCSPWGCKQLDTTERLNWTDWATELNWSWWKRLIHYTLFKKKDKQKSRSWWKEAGKAIYQIWEPVWWVPWLLAVCKSKLLLWEQSEAVSKKTFSSVRIMWVREDILIFLLLQPSTEQIKYLFPCDMVDISKSTSDSHWILYCRYWCFYEVLLCWVFKTKQITWHNERSVRVCLCAQYIWLFVTP